MFIEYGFGSLMDIDKLIPANRFFMLPPCFGSLMDIDKLIPQILLENIYFVLVL